MEKVECSVCGEEVGRGPAGLGLKQHSGRHKREFRELTGREPDSYDEVREFFAGPGRAPTLEEAILEEPQAAIPDF